MEMRRPQIESRTRRYAARQGVSDFETAAPEDALMRATGTVKFFNMNKGFGFCSLDGGGDVFVHNHALKRSGIEDGVKQGERLEFDLLEVPDKAPKAENIKRIASI